MSLDEYLGLQRLQSPISDFWLDKLRIPNGLTTRQWERLEKDALKTAQSYSQRRITARAEYWAAVERGEITPKSTAEILMDRANGHQDNASTQAARRCCEKRGIAWRREE